MLLTMLTIGAEEPLAVAVTQESTAATWML
jgi:hypothetical protein